jgi:murein DD-endopeptidase MepM/ murein hydrolase activator NlpD
LPYPAPWSSQLASQSFGLYNAQVRRFTACVVCLALLGYRGAAADASDSLAVFANARSTQPGELIVLTITSSSPLEEVRVRLFDRAVPVHRDGSATWSALVGIDLAVKPGMYAIDVEGRAGSQEVRTTYPLTVRARRFPTRALTVDPAFVNPPSSEQERIKSEAADLERLWQRQTPERSWKGPFVAPVPGATASRFGLRSIFNGQPRSPHNGADFASPAGTPVGAPNAGTVVLARSLYFSGQTVVLDHGMGLLSLLAHLSKTDVQEGDVVSGGDRIGAVGATGRVTGPHLHWAVRVNGARVDPEAVLALLGRD